MDFSNLVKTVVHYILIRRMTYLDCRNGFAMVSVLVYMVTHWTRPTMNHDTRLSIVMIHQTTILHGF